MKYRVVVTPEASRDIRDSFRWLTEERSVSVAEKWLNGLLNMIHTLDTSPERWPLAAESEKFAVDVRELLHGRSKRGKHRILYTIKENEVRIIYIRHSAQDEVEP